MISFLHPWVLAGLVAAGVPILLHLIQRRQPPVVVFPAVRYLVDTTREHQKRLKLRNWLLLIIRTLLIVFLVLAAAGPTAPIQGAPGHSPAAMVLVFDNSLSSGVVVDGTPRLATLREAALDILARATSEDLLWLILADGVARRGDAAMLSAMVDSTQATPARLDLGTAIRDAETILSNQSLPGEIIVVSDLQASAVSAASVTRPLLVIRPEDATSQNLGVAAVDPGPQPWSLGGSRVTISVTGDSTLTAPLSVRLGSRPGRQALARVGLATSIPLGSAVSGWWPIEVDLDPDELLGDNSRSAIVRVAPVARVTWSPDLQYFNAAAEVLASNGRIERGPEVVLGRLGSTFSIVEPPADPAELGALNRSLHQRGVGWRFGRLQQVTAMSDSGALLGAERVSQRYTLEPTGSGRTGVIATVGGAPWIVRGGNVVMLGSRMDPAWTGVPLSASFMPFMDALLNRVARGEVTVVGGFPGDPVNLPDQVSEVRIADRRWAAEGGAPFRPAEKGIYYLLSGRDTIGALAVNFDPRESRLERARDGAVEDLWKGATIVSPEDGPARAFSLGVRSDLRGPLLWLGLILGLAEVLLASVWRKAT